MKALLKVLTTVSLVTLTVACGKGGDSSNGNPQAPAAPVVRTPDSVPPVQRVAVTGAIFVKDTSFPKLGDAYRDPTGLVWGELITGKRAECPHCVLPLQSAKMCASIGARLPTALEYDRLAAYLGVGTAAGYIPYTSDGKTKVLADLATPTYDDHNPPLEWTSTVDQYYQDRSHAYPRCYKYYESERGTTKYGTCDALGMPYYARCVIQK